MLHVNKLLGVRSSLENDSVPVCSKSAVHEDRILLVDCQTNSDYSDYTMGLPRGGRKLRISDNESLQEIRKGLTE